MAAASPPAEPAARLGAAHRRRMRELWRSAGWPCQDLVEAELLAAGMLARERDAAGRETLRLTDAGVRQIAHQAAGQRQARDAHEALVWRVAREMQRAGRVVWLGLSLRAPLDGDRAAGPAGGALDGALDDAAAARQDAFEPELGTDLGSDTVRRAARATRWAIAMPDVFSIRHTMREDFVEPIVHEIKAHRSDLLSDLRKTAKREAYRALASQCWYVLRPGIGHADEIPPEYGVLIAHQTEWELARAAPKRAMRLAFATWMALARANALAPLEDDAQGLLGDPG